MPKTVPVTSDATPTATGRQSTDADPRPFGHLRGLDGLRAVAVLAVVIYHAGLGALSGGFLGVEVFFVISGFLITALLLAEHRATGRIDPVRFWLRRGRRLLPALFFLLASTLTFAVLVVPDEIARLRADALAAFAYVTNWHLIAGDQSYFESIGRPSLFIHLWSLAIEEQFYLVWPLVLGAMLLVGRRSGARADPGRRRRFGRLDGAPVRPDERPVARLLRHRHAADRAAAGIGPGVRLGSPAAGRGAHSAGDDQAEAAEARGQGCGRRGRGPLGQCPARAGPGCRGHRGARVAGSLLRGRRCLRAVPLPGRPRVARGDHRRS